jgi:hypothetical protein
MRSKRARILSAVLLGSALSLAAAAPAAAGGWHYGGYHHGGWRHHRHSTIFLGFNYGFPIYRPRRARTERPAQPQTSCAVSTTRRSFATSSASVILLPWWLFAALLAVGLIEVALILIRSRRP